MFFPSQKKHSSIKHLQPAGLCLASRLSENPDVSVLVLEAGSDRFDDPRLRTLQTILLRCDLTLSQSFLHNMGII